MPTILVITADTHGHHLLDALLNLHGYGVMFAARGRQGLELFRARSPDVVMLDINIPDMNALMVLRQIRGLQARQPVIVLAGDGTSLKERQVRTLGINEIIDKNLMPGRIVAILKLLLKAPESSKGTDLQLKRGEWRIIS